jgi:hypothetical protein
MIHSSRAHIVRFKIELGNRLRVLCIEEIAGLN